MKEIHSFLSRPKTIGFFAGVNAIGSLDAFARGDCWKGVFMMLLAATAVFL